MLDDLILPEHLKALAGTVEGSGDAPYRARIEARGGTSWPGTAPVRWATGAISASTWWRWPWRGWSRGDDAVSLPVKAGGKKKRRGKEDELRAWLAEVRRAHKPKRNFMKLLDAL